MNCAHARSPNAGRNWADGEDHLCRTIAPKAVATSSINRDMTSSTFREPDLSQVNVSGNNQPTSRVREPVSRN